MLQSVKKGISFGFFSITAIWISSLFTLNASTKYTGNLLTTGLTAGLLIFGIIFCTKSLRKSNQPGKLFIRQLAIAAISFSLTVGLLGALIHYIDAYLIDIEFAKNALKASQEKWKDNNYSKEAIAGQIEFTDTFQSPWKWAVTSGIFISIIGFSFFIFISCLNGVRNIKTKKFQPA